MQSTTPDGQIARAPEATNGIGPGIATERVRKRVPALTEVTE